MQSETKESWTESLKTTSLISWLFLPYLLARLGVTTVLDRSALALIWGVSFFLLVLYVPYRLDCWTIQPDERPGLFRYCAEASRKEWLLLFCLVTISYVFVSPTAIFGGPKDLGRISVREGDSIIWTPAAYIATPPARGDIVIYNLTDGEYLRRIVGLPDEMIEIYGGRVAVNDILLDESYIKIPTPETPAFTFKTRRKLASDEYLILADDRSKLHEQEIVAKRKNILGKAFFRYSPIRDFGLLPDVKRPGSNP